ERRRQRRTVDLRDVAVDDAHRREAGREIDRRSPHVERSRIEAGDVAVERAAREWRRNGDVDAEGPLRGDGAECIAMEYEDEPHRRQTVRSAPERIAHDVLPLGRARTTRALPANTALGRMNWGVPADRHRMFRGASVPR